jgi:hypothetical protein
MFKKPPSIKNLSVLRSSDRKKIVQQIIQSYSLQDADSTEIRNALLPDGAQVCPKENISRFLRLMCCVVGQVHNAS